MNTTVETLDGGKVKLTVTVDAKEVDEKINGTYKDFSRRYSFPGFRKGKAPRPVIDNALGAEAVLAVATDELVNDTYPIVVEDERLSPVGQPKLDEADEHLVEAGKPYTFTFEVDVKPSFELTSYDPVKVELPCEGATEAEVDEQVKALQEHYSTYEDASAATKLKEGNQADMAMKATDADGNAIELVETDSRLYEPGNAVLFNEAFDEQVLGMKKGETRTFTIEVPSDETAVYLVGHAGQPMTFEVTVNSVKKKVTPELTDEWASEIMGFDSVEDLRKNVEESIASQKANVIPRIKENAALSQLIERLDADVPEAMAEDEEAGLLQDFFNQLQNAGLSFDDYLAQQGITADQFKQDVKLQAADNAKQQLALEAWARHKGLEATDADVTQEFVNAGVDDPAQLEKQWRKQGRLHLIRDGILRAKALEDLLSSAEVTEVDFAKRAQEDAKKGTGKKGAKAKEE